MRILRELFEGLCQLLSPQTKAELEIKNVKKALQRTENKITDIEYEYSCCKNRWEAVEYDSVWRDLIEKADRQRMWLSVLLKRQGLTEEANKILSEVSEIPLVYKKKANRYDRRR